MKVKTLTQIPSARGIIPAGMIIEIPPAVMEKLKGKVVAIPPTSEAVQAGPIRTVWQNSSPQGTPEARRESLQAIVDAMLHGVILDSEQTQRVNDMVGDVLAGKAKLADLQAILGGLH